MVYTLTVHLYANDHPDSIPRIKVKLIEAARVYRKDKETIDWLVMQDVHDPRAFTIVERFENESVGQSNRFFQGKTNLGLNPCRARNITSKIHIGRPLTPMLSRFSTEKWIFADMRSLIPART
jgi:hypothetical protein